MPKLNGTFMELLEIIIIGVFIIGVILILLRFFKYRSLSLSSKNYKLETGVVSKKKLQYYVLVNRLFELKNYEILKRQVNYADMKGLEIINIQTEAYKNELNLCENHFGNFSPTKLEDYKNYQLLVLTFYKDMKNLFENYFKDNGYEQFIMTNDTYKNIEIEKRFNEYKRTRIDSIMIAGSEHSDKFYTGHYITREKLTELNRLKCGLMIGKCLNDIFNYAREIYKEVNDEIEKIEIEIENF
jgi:hypothetical protein